MNEGTLLVVGSGAMGTLFAARCAAAGVKVTVLTDWEAGRQALHLHGAMLDGAASLVEAVSRVEAGRVFQSALVLVKSWQTEAAAESLAATLAPDGIALSLQNGLGNAEILAARLGERRAAQGITTLGVTLTAPGCASLRGDGPVALPRRKALMPLTALLKSAGFVVEQPANMPVRIWSKLAVNAAINPLSALLRVPNGELLQLPSACMLLDGLAQETAAVARALGVKLTGEHAVRLAHQVAESTAHNLSSMLQDLLRGAPTEVEAINGAVVRLGCQAGIPTPLNASICSLVLAAAHG